MCSVDRTVVRSVGDYVIALWFCLLLCSNTHNLMIFTASKMISDYFLSNNA